MEAAVVRRAAPVSFSYVLGYRVDVDAWRIQYIGGIPGEGVVEQLWSMDLDQFVDDSWALEEALQKARQWAKLMQLMKMDGASVEQMKAQLVAMHDKNAAV